MMFLRSACGLLVVMLVSQPDVFAIDPTTPIHERFRGPEMRSSYQKHVLPLLSKRGCSGRECHGSFQGRGGFRLSLFGYDFKQDHDALLQGGEPRVNLKSPENSLIVLKPTMQEEHEGQKIFDKGSWEYNILVRWIEDGAHDDSVTNPEFSYLEIQPKELVFKKAGETVQLRVLAHWEDGASEDVTDIARFRTNDEAVAKVDEKTGVVTAEGKGDTHIIAFYDNGIASVTAILPVSDNVGPKYPPIAASTKVDELILAKLRKVGILPSELCTDEEFLRRASLDITGTLPTPDEIRQFNADNSKDKRAKKVDEMLQRPTYAAWWTTVLCDITGNNTHQLSVSATFLGPEMARNWYEWIYRRVSENIPYDKMMEGLVLAVGRHPSQSYADYCAEMTTYVRSNNPADFARRETMPFFWGRRNMQRAKERALMFSHTFLGVKLQCAECHKHPFDQWTQEDFNCFQEFFTGITYKPLNRQDPEIAKMMWAVGVDPREPNGGRDDPRKRLAQAARNGKAIPFPQLIVQNLPQDHAKIVKNINDPTGNLRAIAPRVLGGEEVMLANYSDPRQPLMDWMRSPDNPYFARIWVNRVWAHYFGVGIIAPADDLNLANPPSNAKLLDYLTENFIQSGYDMKWLHRVIATSDAYQRSRKTNPTNSLDRRNFSHALLRRLPAEVAMDAIAMATAGGARSAALHKDLRNRYIGLKTTQGSNENGHREYSLGIFGRPDRITACDCERSNDPTLLQSLFLFNDGEIHTFINRRGWISELQHVERFGDLTQPIKSAKARLGLQEKNNEVKRAAATRSLLAHLEAAQTVNIDDRTALVEELYLRTVSRMPTPEERDAALDVLSSAPSISSGMAQLLWVMLNTKEFILNH